jgi:hypothetical protein
MDMTAIIDVAIGLSLIYLGASLYVTIINEFIAQTFRLRGRQLAKDLLTLIDDDSLKDKLAAVPALMPFLKNDGRGGSFVDTKILSRLLVGALGDGKAEGASMKELIEVIGSLPDSTLKTQLSALAQSASESVDQFVESLANWADTSLSVMGEVYKKRIQVISFAIGLAAAVVFNLDTLTITERLFRDKEARDAVVAVATEFTEQTQKDALNRCVKDSTGPDCAAMKGLVDAIQGRNETLGRLPIFWENWPAFQKGIESVTFYDWFHHLIGWLVTALAISLGAPFWFDLLNRLINVRHGMAKPEPTASDA